MTYDELLEWADVNTPLDDVLVSLYPKGNWGDVEFLEAVKYTFLCDPPKGMDAGVVAAADKILHSPTIAEDALYDWRKL